MYVETDVNNINAAQLLDNYNFSKIKVEYIQLL